MFVGQRETRRKLKAPGNGSDTQTRVVFYAGHRTDDFWKLLPSVLCVYRGGFVSRINDIFFKVLYYFMAELKSISTMLVEPSTVLWTQKAFEECVLAKFKWIPKGCVWLPFFFKLNHTLKTYGEHIYKNTAFCKINIHLPIHLFLSRTRFIRFSENWACRSSVLHLQREKVGLGFWIFLPALKLSGFRTNH